MPDQLRPASSFPISKFCLFHPSIFTRSVATSKLDVCMDFLFSILPGMFLLLSLTPGGSKKYRRIIWVGGLSVSLGLNPLIRPVPQIFLYSMGKKEIFLGGKYRKERGKKGWVGGEKSFPCEKSFSNFGIRYSNETGLFLSKITLYTKALSRYPCF